MAGVTRLELATSGVTGQRSNQLSYTPDWEGGKLRHVAISVNGQKVIRATDAKEVGVGNTAKETYRCPDRWGMLCLLVDYVNLQISPLSNSQIYTPFRA